MIGRHGTRAARWIVACVLFGTIGRVSAQECIPPPSGLIGWWPGDGSGGNISAPLDPAVAMNGATYGLGIVNQAFSLDGMNDYFDVGNPSDLRLGSGDFTVDAWVRFNRVPPPSNVAPGGDQAIVDKMYSKNNLNDDGWRLLKQDDNRFWFCFGGANNPCAPNGPTAVQSMTKAVAGPWYHVAGVRSSNTISIYVNGTLEATKPFGATSVNTDSVGLVFGMHVLNRPTPGSGGTNTSFVDGMIDEIEIFNRALAASEIAAINGAGPSGKCHVGPGFEYAVKFVCGKSGPRSAPGIYYTLINVHNPSSERIVIYKKFAVAGRQAEKAGEITGFVTAPLGPDGAFAIDCPDILGHGATPGAPTDGFVVMESPTELDVVGMYTATGASRQIDAMAVERVPARKSVGYPPRQPARIAAKSSS